MKFLTDEEIQSFIDKHDYDIRKTGNARWLDQKCTPDVLCIIADCIIQYLSKNGTDKCFTAKDIWFDEYTINNIHTIFKKADVTSNATSSEYNKFFGQPLKLFAYAGILIETQVKKTNCYVCASIELLEYISIRERNALQFLYYYITKVLKDSGLDNLFNEFFVKQNQGVYEKVKKELLKFNLQYTGIGNKGSNGKLETNRIFTKIINILAFVKDKLGTERGRLSKNKITYDELMYNKDNFRDIYAKKPKSISRKEFAKQQKYEPSLAFYQYQSNKAKQYLKAFNNTYNNGNSEVFEENECGVLASQMHHIFPSSQFPQISGFYENIIALTPNQHYLKAHPNNNTQSINIDYQYICLVAKTATIKENLTSENSVKIYEFNKFLFVIHIGLGDESYENIENGDYSGILTKLALSYSK